MARENDKIGLEHSTLLTARAVTALKEAQTRTLSIGDAWMFPAVRGPAGCLTSHAANHISSAPRPNHRVTQRRAVTVGTHLGAGLPQASAGATQRPSWPLAGGKAG